MGADRRYARQDRDFRETFKRDLSRLGVRREDIERRVAARLNWSIDSAHNRLYGNGIPVSSSHRAAFFDAVTEAVTEIGRESGLPPSVLPTGYSRFSRLTSSTRELDLSAWVEDPGQAAFVEWIRRSKLRPEKYAGQQRQGIVRVEAIWSFTEHGIARQLDSYKYNPGDAIMCWIQTVSTDPVWLQHCYAKGESADRLYEVEDVEAFVWQAKLRCVGALKYFSTDVPALGDEDQGVLWLASYLVSALEQVSLE